MYTDGVNLGACIKVCKTEGIVLIFLRFFIQYAVIFIYGGKMISRTVCLRNVIFDMLYDVLYFVLYFILYYVLR